MSNKSAACWLCDAPSLPPEMVGAGWVMACSNAVGCGAQVSGPDQDSVWIRWHTRPRDRVLVNLKAQRATLARMALRLDPGLLQRPLSSQQKAFRQSHRLHDAVLAQNIEERSVQWGLRPPEGLPDPVLVEAWRSAWRPFSGMEWDVEELDSLPSQGSVVCFVAAVADDWEHPGYSSEVYDATAARRYLAEELQRHHLVTHWADLADLSPLCRTDAVPAGDEGFRAIITRYDYPMAPRSLRVVGRQYLSSNPDAEPWMPFLSPDEVLAATLDELFPLWNHAGLLAF